MIIHMYYENFFIVHSSLINLIFVYYELYSYELFYEINIIDIIDMIN